MASSTSPSSSLYFSASSLSRSKKFVPHRIPSTKIMASSSTVGMILGFDSLKQTFSVDVAHAEGRPLNVPLIAPFTIASSRLDAVSNVAVRIELRNGSVGWGEAPVLPLVTAEDQPGALRATANTCRFLVGSGPMTLGLLLKEIGRVLDGHEFASQQRQEGIPAKSYHSVWDHYNVEDRTGVRHAVCKVCAKAYKHTLGSGTGTLGKRLKKHVNSSDIADSSQPQLTFGGPGGALGIFQYDPVRNEYELARYVMADEQPLNFGESCEFTQYVRTSLQPAYCPVPRNTLKRRCFTGRVRAGVEMALIDAVANSIRVPLWRLFGGASNSITTDITIPIVSPNEAAKLAEEYCKRGFTTLKLKVGKSLNSDIEVLKAIRLVHPDCTFILDANEGYTDKEAIEVLDKLHEMGVVPILFEQPVHRDNWEGLRRVSEAAKEKYGVSVAADESCRSVDDAHRIVKGNLAHVINIKLAKSGVLGALDIIEVAKSAGVGLMIGGMVETRLAMGFAGHLAAGLGCFRFIDLDTPLLLSEDPVVGGYDVSGPVYKFTNSRGHGGFLHWANID